MSAPDVMCISHRVVSLLTDPTYFWTLAWLVIIGDIFLSTLIIRVIPYTEIDWKTYMMHVSVYLKGERNYSNISGPTGPLVYPAGHLYIHRFLYNISDSGTNVRAIQHIYAGLYGISQMLTCAIYNKAGNMPNWLVLLLPLSKRLHSIYVLRLFNDCWAFVVAQCAILAFQDGLDDFAIIVLSLAISIKMSTILYLPAVIVILTLRRGLFYTFRRFITIISIQLFLAIPFIRHDWSSYANSAFDFSRVFLYKWTVNWRFLTEEQFLERRWAYLLLAGHTSILICFGFRWCTNEGGVVQVIGRAFRRPLLPATLNSKLLDADYVATTLFTANLIGIACARSLHYQFYSWYAQQIPFLVWHTPFPFVINWNVYPSTTFSSLVLLGMHSALLVGLFLYGRPNMKKVDKVV